MNKNWTYPTWSIEEVTEKKEAKPEWEAVTRTEHCSCCNMSLDDMASTVSASTPDELDRISNVNSKSLYTHSYPTNRTESANPCESANECESANNSESSTETANESETANDSETPQETNKQILPYDYWNASRLPWGEGRQAIFDALDNDIKEFVASVDRQIKVTEEKNRTKLLELFNQDIRNFFQENVNIINETCGARCKPSFFSDVRILPYGSYASNVYLPGSDLDLVLTGLPANFVRECSHGDRRHQILLLLAEYLDSRTRLRTTNSILSSKIQSISFIPASTPLLLLRTFATSPSQALNVDFTIEDNFHLGVEASRLVSLYCSQYPQLRPIALVIKQLLRTRGVLSSPSLGGISSYTIILLIVAYFQTFSTHQYNLGQVLIKILSFYGGIPSPDSFLLPVSSETLFSQYLPSNQHNANTANTCIGSVSSHASSLRSANARTHSSIDANDANESIGGVTERVAQFSAFDSKVMGVRVSLPCNFHTKKSQSHSKKTSLPLRTSPLSPLSPLSPGDTPSSLLSPANPVHANKNAFFCTSKFHYLDSVVLHVQDPLLPFNNTSRTTRRFFDIQQLFQRAVSILLHDCCCCLEAKKKKKKKNTPKSHVCEHLLYKIFQYA